MPAFLKKKVAGLPLFFWLLIIGAGVGIGLYLRNRNAAAGDVAEPAEDEGAVIPYDQMPVEAGGYGDYPITGGGPPIVSGGGAIRLDPGTLRIVLVNRRNRKRRQPPVRRDCRRGYKWSAAQRRCVRVRRVAAPHAASRNQ
jgi:hypothetical protein